MKTDLPYHLDDLLKGEAVNAPCLGVLAAYDGTFQPMCHSIFVCHKSSAYVLRELKPSCRTGSFPEVILQETWPVGNGQ